MKLPCHPRIVYSVVLLDDPRLVSVDARRNTPVAKRIVYVHVDQRLREPLHVEHQQLAHVVRWFVLQAVRLAKVRSTVVDFEQLFDALP